ncbi:hypothetical protein SALBM217S_09008 [Streptomyces griseoloalbus]
MISPDETVSLSGSYVTGLRTTKSESSYTSSLGRWCALRASSTASGCSANSRATRSNSSAVGSCSPIQTKPPADRASSSASEKSWGPSERCPSR